MKLNDKVYNILKWVCLIVTDAFCTLIITLTSLWHWNIPIEAIVGTITAISTFIGIILGFSSVSYKKSKEDNSNAGY